MPDVLDLCSKAVAARERDRTALGSVPQTFRTPRSRPIGTQWTADAGEPRQFLDQWWNGRPRQLGRGDELIEELNLILRLMDEATSQLSSIRNQETVATAAMGAAGLAAGAKWNTA